MLAACIRNNVVVNVAAYDPAISAAWLEAVTANFDEVRLVESAGIGWTVEADGLRPLSPYPSWLWDGAEWVAPVPRPDGNVMWDEAEGVWVEVLP